MRINGGTVAISRRVKLPRISSFIFRHFGNKGPTPYSTVQEVMPSFSIEVPGESNPLTEGLLVHSLTSAASSNPNQIQTGTKQLQQWEKTPGYYKHLQSAYLDHRLPVEIRYLAIIQLKNGIDKYWRKTATK